MPVDFKELRRQSRIAAMLTMIASLIVLASLIFGYKQINQAENKVADLRKQQKSLVAQNENLALQNDQLAKKSNLLRLEINSYISSTDSAKTKEVPGATVSGYPVKISIVLTDLTKRAAAEKAMEALQSYGYTVTGIEEKPEDITHETTVRFFQYDRSTVAIGRHLVKLLQGVGFTVRTEFDDEFVGSPPPPFPGTYEFWIGTNPSYHPSPLAR